MAEVNLSQVQIARLRDKIVEMIEDYDRLSDGERVNRIARLTLADKITALTQSVLVDGVKLTERIHTK